jgi:hypothetical protein
MKNFGENKIRKIPLLCVWVKKVTTNPHHTKLLLADFTEQINGTITKGFMKVPENANSLVYGSVLLLQDVSLFRTNYSKNCYHLNITVNNVITIYYPNVEQGQEISKRSLQNINVNKIKELIDEFEKEYIHFDFASQSQLVDTSLRSTSGNLNKTNNVNNVNNKANGSANRAAPYQIPPQYNKSRPQVNNSTNSLKATSSSISNKKANESTNKTVSTTINNNNNNNQRNFQFKTTNKSTPAIEKVNGSIQTKQTSNDQLDLSAATIELLANDTDQDEEINQLFLNKHSTQNTNAPLSEGDVRRFYFFL